MSLCDVCDILQELFFYHFTGCFLKAGAKTLMSYLI